MHLTKILYRNYPDDILLKLEDAYEFIDSDIEKAIDIYNTIISIYPDEPYAYSMRGFALFTKALYADAIVDFSFAISKNKNASNTIWMKAKAHEQLGQLENAIEDYKKYILCKPEEAEPYLNLGLIYEYKKDNVNALHYYSISNEIKKTNYLEGKILKLSQRIALRV